MIWILLKFMPVDCMKKIYASVYGCPTNIADYEMALGLLKENDFEIVDTPAKSDLNIIFTCVVKNPTEQRMIHLIKKFTKLDKPLIVAGCMPRIEQKLIEKINPLASLVGPDSIEKIVDVTRVTLEGRKVIFIEDLKKPKLCLPRARKNSNIGIIEISNGCLSNCSYCCVKFARGKLFSYPVEKIVEEARQAVKNGCKELWITSQDNSCYGKDIDTSLPELLKEICKIEGKFSVRVGMMNPFHLKEILDEMIHVYQNEKILKFLHLPVQSGSDRILKLMNREYAVKDFIEVVEKFRKEILDLFLSTDVIVGFPGETEEDFQKTVELMKKIKPNKINISKFGARPMTEAAKMKQLDNKIINERSKLLHELVKNNFTS